MPQYLLTQHVFQNKSDSRNVFWLLLYREENCRTRKKIMSCSEYINRCRQYFDKKVVFLAQNRKVFSQKLIVTKDALAWSPSLID